MKERFNRNVFKRLKRIEDLLNPSPNTHRITPEMQELYNSIINLKKRSAEERTESAGKS